MLLYSVSYLLTSSIRRAKCISFAYSCIIEFFDIYVFIIKIKTIYVNNCAYKCVEVVRCLVCTVLCSVFSVLCSVVFIVLHIVFFILYLYSVCVHIVCVLCANICLFCVCAYICLQVYVCMCVSCILCVCMYVREVFG